MAQEFPGVINDFLRKVGDELRFIINNQPQLGSGIKVVGSVGLMLQAILALRNIEPIDDEIIGLKQELRREVENYLAFGDFDYDIVTKGPYATAIKQYSSLRIKGFQEISNNIVKERDLDASPIDPELFKKGIKMKNDSQAIEIDFLMDAENHDNWADDFRFNDSFTVQIDKVKKLLKNYSGANNNSNRTGNNSKPRIKTRICSILRQIYERINPAVLRNSRPPEPVSASPSPARRQLFGGGYKKVKSSIKKAKKTIKKKINKTKKSHKKSK
jgi:hypothetical protein